MDNIRMNTMATNLSTLLKGLWSEQDDENESMIIYWNKKERKIHHGGSMGGHLFIEQNKIVDKFYKFCSEIYKASTGFGSDSIVKPSMKETSVSDLTTDTATIEEFKDEGKLSTDVTQTTHSNINSVTCEFSDADDAEVPLPSGFEDDSGHASNGEVEPEVKVRDKKSTCKNMERKPSKKVKRPRRRKKTHLSTPVKRHRRRAEVKESLDKAEVNDSMIKSKGKRKSDGVDVEVEEEKVKATGQIKEEGCDTVADNQQKSDEVCTVTSKSSEDVKEEDSIDNLASSNDGKVTCKICKKTFANKFTLERHHRRLHLKYKMYECHVCTLTFKTRENRDRHYNTHKKNDGNFICLECGKIFSEREQYFQHVNEMHKDKKPKVTRVCTLCNVQFINVSGYLKHMESHLNLKIFKCYVCHETFQSQSQLDTHVEKHTITLTYKCHKCDNVCRSSEEYQKHIEKYCPANLRPATCHFDEMKDTSLNHDTSEMQVQEKEGTNISGNELEMENENGQSKNIENAGLAYDSDKNKDNHLTKLGVNGDKETSSEATDDKDKQNIYPVIKHSRNPEGHTCDKCGRTFQFAMALYKHKLLHDERGLFPCRFCTLTFDTSERLTRHSIVHRAIKPYICKNCKAGFMEHEQLVEHMKKHKRGKTFMCEECGKCFTTNTILRIHMRNHTGVRPFKCDYCNKSFISKETLHTHENTHTKERVFMCDICGMVFYRKCLMYTHKKIHSDVKEHKCSKCGKECRSKASLRTHYVSMHLTPQEAKTFKHTLHECNTCKKYFVDKNDLVVHERVHTGEKPYSCSYCGKAFSDRSNMKQHEKTHWKVKPFSCEVCGKGFVLKRDLLRHSKNHQMGEQMAVHPVVPQRKRGRPVEQTTPHADTEEELRQREIEVQIDHLTSKEAGLHISRSDDISHQYVTADGYLHISNSQGFVDQEVVYDSAQGASNFNILIL